MFVFYFLKLFMRTNFKNVENIIFVFFENYYYYLYLMFYILFSVFFKKSRTKCVLYDLFIFFKTKNNFQKP